MQTSFIQFVVGCTRFIAGLAALNYGLRRGWGVDLFGSFSTYISVPYVGQIIAGLVALCGLVSIISMFN